MATTEVRPPRARREKTRGGANGAAQPRWRERLVPKTVMGLTAIVLAAAVGAAFSGVLLYSYYEYRLNEDETKVSVYTWQEDKDLALIILPLGNLPKLDIAPKDPPLKIGERVFALSGLGGAGASVAEGLVADVSSAGIQHDAAIGPSFQ